MLPLHVQGQGHQVLFTKHYLLRMFIDSVKSRFLSDLFRQVEMRIILAQVQFILVLPLARTEVNNLIFQLEH
jgi:hypothetical protein